MTELLTITSVHYTAAVFALVMKGSKSNPCAPLLCGSGLHHDTVVLFSGYWLSIQVGAVSAALIFSRSHDWW
jgi:hypothetical protein